MMLEVNAINENTLKNYNQITRKIFKTVVESNSPISFSALSKLCPDLINLKPLSEQHT